MAAHEELGSISLGVVGSDIEGYTVVIPLLLELYQMLMFGKERPDKRKM